MNSTILIIEDDHSIRQVLTQYLESEGYRTESVTDGQSALEYLSRNSNTGMILLDLRMPGMDGREFRMQQLKSPRLASIPVIVISADRNATSIAREFNAAGVVCKPFDPDHLIAGIQKGLAAG